MDKLRILKEFERLALKESLATDEVMLYLLLLANCGARRHGRITYNTIRGALGKEFSPARFKQACRRLSAHGLIEVVSSPLEGIAGNDFSVKYRVLNLAEGQRH